MKGIRSVQSKHASIEDALAGGNLDLSELGLSEGELETLATMAADAMERGEDGVALQQDWLRKKVDALKEQARRMLGEANYYAAEAYLSEGPLQHIVFGNQSGNPEVLEQLQPEHFLESINEQTGDFMKDVGHYGDDNGTAFYQTAKYLSRMFEGILKLSQKDAFIEVEDSLPTLQRWGGAEAVKNQVEIQLMPIRGAKGEWALKTAEEKSAEGQRLGEAIYGVATIDALSQAVLSLSAELNAEVRKVIQMREDSVGGTAFQDGY